MRKEKQMGKFTVILTVVAAMLSADVTAADAFLLPTSNILWHTAPSSDFDVPVILPRGATSAKLAVDGKGYSRTYEEIGDGVFSLSLPGADPASGENIYDLTLTFNDEPQTVQRAKLAVCQGAAFGGFAKADVRTAGSTKWREISQKALLPIEAGVDTVFINGKPEDESLWSSPGWFYLSVQSGKTYDLMLKSASLTVADATMKAAFDSFIIVIK